MCGIFGILNPVASGISSEAAKNALDLLAERGPDDHGWYQDEQVMLGHRRLSVMDLSSAGRQPIANEDESVWIVFNGEIYGFRELRAELEDRGHRFRSNADTEVILHGYEEWGRGVLDRIDGMFAFAIWDRPAGRLFLARDRLGKKPLFVARRGSGFAFCSQIRPLVSCGFIEPIILHESLREYLFSSYVNGPKTIFEGVEQVPAGSWLEVSPNGVEKGRYWSLLEASAERFADEQERFEELLESALRTRLVSDAPMGIFLSGGLDSSVVAALCQRESDTIRSSFSVGFDNPSYDERAKARRVAERIGTQHHEIVCVAADVPALVEKLTRSADHLLADQSLVPLAKLAVEAKQTVKVVLTGDGGDELLAGYATYKALAIAKHYLRFVPGPARSQLARLARFVPASGAKMARSALLGRFLDATTGGIGQAHTSWRSIWSHDEIDALLTSRTGVFREWESAAAYMEIAEDRSLLQRAVFTDISTWLVDSILAKVDRATMATGLEARSPLLDSRLVEFAFGSMLARDKRNVGKKPLRRLGTALLGADLAGAKKEGFQTPFADWFVGPLRSYLKERIDFLDRRLPGAFRAEILWKFEADHASGRHNHDFKLWNLVALSEWTALYPGVILGEPGANNPNRIYEEHAFFRHL